MNVLHPTRVVRRATEHLEGPPDEIFPLLCPVRRVEWATDWDPTIVFTTSGVVEPDCTFISKEPEGDVGTIWALTRYDPEHYELEAVRIVPEVTIGHLAIRLEPVDNGGGVARVVFTCTALSRAGRAEVEALTEERWQALVSSEVVRLNHYVKTGGLLDDLGAGYE